MSEQKNQDALSRMAFFAMAWARSRKPDHFKELRDHYMFLKRLRHVNHVLVSSDDDIGPDTAAVLAPHTEAKDGPALLSETQERMKNAAEIVSDLMEEEP